jgi:diguanylate cyclase (GGDEF)-like protein
MWVLAAALACATPTHAQTTVPAAELIARAEQQRTADNAAFRASLAQLDASRQTLTEPQKWHLRYLHAWQQDFGGDIEGAQRNLREIIAQAPDPLIRFRARTTLLNTMALTRHYEDAYRELDLLMQEMPQVHDTTARFQALGEAAQLMDVPPGEGVCRAGVHSEHARYRRGGLKSSDRGLAEVIRICEAQGQPVFANYLRGDVAAMLIAEHDTAGAIAYLRKHLPEVERVSYKRQMAQFKALLAQALLAEGQWGEARSSALAAIDDGRGDGISEPLAIAYQVLYAVAHHAGNDTEALGWYQKYSEAERAYLDDASAQAQAYQRVHLRLAERRREAEALGSRNRILQMQQSLDRKAMQASGLLIALLLTLLASVAFWVARLKRSQRRFMRLARHDGLTGIFNRQHFVECAEEVLAAASLRHEPACLILFDLDHFKQINDAHGHLVGDRVLRRTAEVCRQQLRRNDIFGRLGGEEFGILLPGCAVDTVMARAEAIRAAIASASDERDLRDVTVSASLGIAGTRDAGYDLRQLMADADDALYRAKHAGRNQVVIASPFCDEPESAGAVSPAR